MDNYRVTLSLEFDLDADTKQDAIELISDWIVHADQSDYVRIESYHIRIVNLTDMSSIEIYHDCEKESSKEVSPETQSTDPSYPFPD